MTFVVGVDENAFGGKALGAVTGNGIAVVEVSMLAGIELDLAVVVEACRKPTIRIDGSLVAIGDAKRSVWGCELERSPTENSRSISW